MIRIRLAKIGKRNAPAYRIVVANLRDKRNGRALEILGYYNPSEGQTKPELDKKAYDAWIAKGAQPTQAVLDLLAGKYQFVAYNPRKTGAEESTSASQVEEAPATEEPTEEVSTEE